jgi:ABC-type glycerol-3-phosphate transport system substrate-binding protein
MIFAPSWVVNDILTARPDLELGVAPVPQAIKEEPAVWGSFWMLAVPTSSKNAQASWDFINFLSQEDQSLMLFNENSNVRKVASPFALVGLAPQLASNPYLKAYVDTAPFAKGGSISSRAGNKAQIDLLKTAINSVLAGELAEKALTTMTK